MSHSGGAGQSQDNAGNANENKDNNKYNTNCNSYNSPNSDTTTIYFYHIFNT